MVYQMATELLHTFQKQWRVPQGEDAFEPDGADVQAVQQGTIHIWRLH